jgi:hypothetical protein
LQLACLHLQRSDELIEAVRQFEGLYGFLNAPTKACVLAWSWENLGMVEFRQGANELALKEEIRFRSARRAR